MGRAKDKLGLAAMQVAVLGAFFGLAIAGEGGWRRFFAHSPLAVLAAATLAFSVVAMFSLGNLSTGVREDRGNRWVLAAFTAISLAGGYLPAYTDRIGLWTLDGEATRWAGVAIFLAGCTLRIWPVFVLGNRFSGLVAIQPGHRLATTGIYSVVRNPSYLGMLVTMAGWALAFRSGVGLMLTALVLVPLVSRIRAEERMLRSQFGTEYEAYCAHTWRLVPWVY